MIELDRNEEFALQYAARHPFCAHWGPGMVLLIDDDFRDRRLLAQQFDHSLISTNEAAAISYAKQYQPDGIVADAGSITELGKLVSSLRAVAPTSPVIVMSAHSSTVEGVRMMDAGAAAYVDKSAIGSLSGLLSRICARLRRAS